MTQTFLKSDQTPNSAVPILERMNFLEMIMKIYNIFKNNLV